MAAAALAAALAAGTQLSASTVQVDVAAGPAAVDATCLAALLPDARSLDCTNEALDLDGAHGLHWRCADAVAVALDDCADSLVAQLRPGAVGDSLSCALQAAEVDGVATEAWLCTMRGSALVDVSEIPEGGATVRPAPQE